MLNKAQSHWMKKWKKLFIGKCMDEEVGNGMRLGKFSEQ